MCIYDEQVSLFPTSAVTWNGRHKSEPTGAMGKEPVDRFPALWRAIKAWQMREGDCPGTTILCHPRVATLEKNISVSYLEPVILYV